MPHPVPKKLKTNLVLVKLATVKKHSWQTSLTFLPKDTQLVIGQDPASTRKSSPGSSDQHLPQLSRLGKAMGVAVMRTTTLRAQLEEPSMTTVKLLISPDETRRQEVERGIIKTG